MTTQPNPENKTAPAETTTPNENDFSKLLDRTYRPDGAFQDPGQFQFAQRVGKMLIKSEMVPPHFRGEDKLANAVIAIDIAQRLRMSPLLVMKQIYMVYGQPAFSAQLAIAAINTSGKFSRLEFVIAGDGDDRGCVASATDLATKQKLLGTRITIKLAKAEGWYDKKDSKWKTMPDQMLCYRAAAWWARLYAPELTMGLMTTEELEDMGEPVKKVEKPIFKSSIPELGDPPQAKVVPPERPEVAHIASNTADAIRKLLAAEGLTESALMATLNEVGFTDSDSLDKLASTDLESLYLRITDLIQRIKAAFQYDTKAILESLEQDNAS